jgi:hypothetical protein
MKIELKTAMNKMLSFRSAAKEPEPKLEGIGFRYKTVQYHLIDDFFEEIKKQKDFFGNVNIYSERFSLPGHGLQDGDALSKDEFQFAIIIRIESKTNPDTYYKKLLECAEIIEKKHNLKVMIDAVSDDYYDENTVTFHTNKPGIFSEE